MDEATPDACKGGDCIHAVRLRHIIAALRVFPNLDVPTDPEATRLVAHIEQLHRDLEQVADEGLRLRARVKELEELLNVPLRATQ